MPEPSGREVSAEPQRATPRSEGAAALALALWAALVGHLLALIATMTASLPPTAVAVAAIACSILAVAALTELDSPEPRARRAVKALIGGHVVTAALLLVGLAAGDLSSMPFAVLPAAVMFGVTCLVAARGAPAVDPPPRPLTTAPRVAAIVLVAQAFLLRWTDSATSLSMSLRAMTLLTLAALGVALLASLSIIALRLRRRWAIAGLLAWTVGWVASTTDLGALIGWSLGGPFPMGPHQLRQLDPELVQLLTTAGGLVVGVALVTSIPHVRFRHSAFVLLAGYAAFGLVAAVSEHRIELATDFPTIAGLRKNRDLADAITALALAAVLWLYWRRSTVSRLPQASTWNDGT